MLSPGAGSPVLNKPCDGIFCLSVCSMRVIINAELLSWVLAKPILIFQSQLRSIESTVLGRAMGRTFLHLAPATLIVKNHFKLFSQH